MLLIKTKIKKSKIHGKGVFADEKIKKGDLIWRFNPKVDKKVSLSKLKSFPIKKQESIKFYSYLNNQKKLVLCGDNARFMNHSENPNTEDKMNIFDKILRREGRTYASRDIFKGQEITSKYLIVSKSGRIKYLK